LALPPPLSLADLAGRLVEVTAPLGARPAARTSWLATLVAQAQAEGETVAWLQTAPGTLYPPDLAAVGVDVEALVVGLLPDAQAQLKAADWLLRSGGFGVVVVDWADERVPPGWPGDGPLGRLLGLCQKHGATLLLRTRPADGSNEGAGLSSGTGLGSGAGLSSLISLRLAVRRQGAELRVEVLKDKRRGPGRSHVELRTAPEGLLWDG
jgi:recombination protein RecA